MTSYSDYAYAICDASFRDHVAGLAVVGTFGEHTQVIDCATSVEAELRALLMALKLAQQSGCVEATFYSDCQAAAQWQYGKLLQGGGRGPEAEARTAVHAMMKAHRGWSVVQVPRAETREADQLAGFARAGGVGERKKQRARAKQLATRSRQQRQIERESVAPTRLTKAERKKLTSGPRR